MINSVFGRNIFQGLSISMVFPAFCIIIPTVDHMFIYNLTICICATSAICTMFMVASTYVCFKLFIIIIYE